jgi:two-component system, OmpR family, sensor histidine kinase KdpD
MRGGGGEEGQEKASPEAPQRFEKKRVISIALSVLAFGFASASALYLHFMQQPVTAALIFLFGIIVVGSILGVRGGLVAALLVSLLDNFILSDPILSFGAASVDDLVPLLAFNISAVASGLIAGRLRDRAQAAERSTSRMQALFQMSQSLHRAFDQRDVIGTAHPFLTSEPVRAVEIYLYNGVELVPQTDTSDYLRLAKELWASDSSEVVEGDAHAFMLGSSREPLGVLVARSDVGTFRDDLKGFVTVFSIALERCNLTNRVAQADILRRSEEFKTALLSSMSHDLRTPLSAITASATSLSRFKDSLDEQTKLNLLETIQEQCERLNRLTTNLLSLGRIQGGIDIDNMPVVDAIEVLGIVLGRARSIATNHKFEKQIKVDAAPVRSEAVMLEQILYNILENAVMHTNPGATILTTAEADEHWIRITIEDSGAGIPDSDLDRVFDRFVKGSGGSNPRSSGLGLSIAKGFAESIGGDVRASRAGGKLGGARIDVVLPSAQGQVR